MNFESNYTLYDDLIEMMPFENFVFTIYTTVATIDSIVGVIGNLMVIIGLCYSKVHPTRNSLSLLLVNMCITDIIISGVINMSTVVGIFAGKDFFKKNDIICEMIASFCLIVCTSSLLNIGIIGFNRYLQMCHRLRYQKLFTQNNTMLLCILTWVGGVIVDLPNFLGWGGHWYDEKTYTCIFNRLASFSYSIFFGTTCVIIPCTLIGFFYVKIFVCIYNAKSRVDKNGFKTSVRVSKGMFVSYIVFSLCWLPFALLIMIDFENKLPKELYMWTMQLAHTNSSINPFLYYYFNPHITYGINLFFKKCIRFWSFNDRHKNNAHKLSLVSDYSLTRV